MCTSASRSFTMCCEIVHFLRFGSFGTVDIDNIHTNEHEINHNHGWTFRLQLRSKRSLSHRKPHTQSPPSPQTNTQRAHTQTRSRCTSWLFVCLRPMWFPRGTTIASSITRSTVRRPLHKPRGNELWLYVTPELQADDKRAREQL